jgi:hypothetical protein
LLLLGGSLACWLVLALLARRFGDPKAALLCGGVALLLCLVPTALTLVWAGWALRQKPEQQLAAVLGGTGVRLFVVLGAGLALTQWVPYYREQSGFWFWLLGCYLFTLALEMVLVLSGRPASRA